MKAIVYSKFGSVHNLELRDIEKPEPGKDEVLIKIRAASVNSWDYDLVTGKPFLTRMAGGGIFKPKIPVLGCDVAGTVESVGEGVSDYKTGDEVFGDISACGWGGFAEYVCARADILAYKPKDIEYIQAAAIPQAGVLALQALKHVDEIKKGFKILINGAGGGVGTFALQIAKLYGAEVTCTDRRAKLDLLLSLGADSVIDYKKNDFTQTGNKYDLIIDNVANRRIKEYERILKPYGRLVLVGGMTKVILKVALTGSWLPKQNKKMALLMHKPNRNDPEELAELVAVGKIETVIDSIYQLEDTAKAIRKLGAGEVIGKAVVTINADS